MMPSIASYAALFVLALITLIGLYSVIRPAPGF